MSTDNFSSEAELSPQLAGLQDLQLTNLTSLPPEIGQLANLQDLQLTHLTTLPPEIGQLVNLQDIYLSHSQMSSLPQLMSISFGADQISISRHGVQADYRWNGREYSIIPESIREDTRHNLSNAIYIFSPGNPVKSLPESNGRFVAIFRDDHVTVLSYRRFPNSWANVFW